MPKIYAKLFDNLEVGDDFPTVLMGVLNLSPESFYKGSIYDTLKSLEVAAGTMIKNGAKILDIGARSTAPWSKKITLEEEIKRLVPAVEQLCKVVPNEVILSIDTQYSETAQSALEITQQFKKKIIINDISCLKTDRKLVEFIVNNNIPIILMASKATPGDLLSIEEIVNEFSKTIKSLKIKGYPEGNIILDPGIGKWIENKTPTHDLTIISNLEKLRTLNKPILVALSRKSFIGATLNIPDPENRLNGTLSATAIAVFNGAHIIRTHDISQQLCEVVKMAEQIRKNK